MLQFIVPELLEKHVYSYMAAKKIQLIVDSL